MSGSELATWVEGARAGRARAVGRLISVVENGAHHPAELRRLMAELAADTGRAHVVGLTGSPGVGKSTTTAALVGVLRAAGCRVGVLAVDPSSPFTGGALLGDRVRMQGHALDDGVYIRSMASRGHLGGLSVVAPQALRVFDAAGVDVVLVETVGVGQSEVEVAGVADTTVVLLAPGMGDGIQAAKAGILEIGDVFCVNKSDRDGASALVRELRTSLALGERAPGVPKPVIVSTVAATGAGIADLWDRIAAHRSAAETSGRWRERRLARARREVEGLALEQLRSRLVVAQAAGTAELAAAVVDGTLDPYAAADRLLASL
jgi:LAO/AO transport system kinase